MLLQIRISAILVLLNIMVFGQVRENTAFWKWSTWSVLQTVPSPSYFEDRNESDGSLKFGLEWQVIPLSYSFNSNKYVSPVQSFYINPVKRFSGSVELFFQPALITGGFRHANISKFLYKAGARAVLPLAQYGEYLAISLGAGFQYYKKDDKKLYKPNIELGVFSFFGMLGLKYNYNFDSDIRHNFGMYFKYY